MCTSLLQVQSSRPPRQAQLKFLNCSIPMDLKEVNADMIDISDGLEAAITKTIAYLR